jgi:radical SAM protein with 4Fe4S-binding SPASM domain
MNLRIKKRVQRGMELIRKGRLDLLICEAGRLFGMKTLVPTLPSYLLIEPTNFCNLHCLTCPTGSGRVRRPPRMMSLDEFQRIVDQGRGYVREILLMLLGEPLMNKDFVRMAQYAVSAGIHVSTSTNGEFFTSKEYCQQMVKSGIQEIVVCLDGADQETLSRFRKGSTFDHITRGIRWLVESKKEQAVSTPRIILQFILMKHNEHQREQMRKLAAELGVDVYREKRVGVNPRDPNFQRLAQELLPSDLSNCRYIRNEDGTFVYKGGPVPNYCKMVFDSAVIGVDGSVIPCCYDPEFNYVMGNVFTEDLKKIWKNKKYKAFRKQILKDRKSIPICDCPEGRVSTHNEFDVNEYDF